MLLKGKELRVYAMMGSRYAGLDMARQRRIGENIAAAREAAGFDTQGAFAEALGVPQPRVSDWENSRYGSVKLETLLKVAKLLKVSVDVLLVGVDPTYDEIVKQSDPSDHTRTADSAHPTGGAARVDSSRERVLEGRLLVAEAMLEEAREQAARLVATLRATDGESAPTSSRSSGRTRKSR